MHMGLFLLQGLTDPLILIKVLQHHGIPTEKVSPV